LGRASFCRLDISKQKQQWNVGYCFVHNCNHFDYCACSLETSKYKILEADVADLLAIFNFYCSGYISLCRAKKRGIELDILLVAYP